ncbi:unnamed protein product [Linum trigynum]|uniref:Uncharacterized protein n=1 Tax=Linum trigynum TaxID=586398 RepID=A0AAV2FWC1_9ROSI
MEPPPLAAIDRASAQQLHPPTETPERRTEMNAKQGTGVDQPRRRLVEVAEATIDYSSLDQTHKLLDAGSNKGDLMTNGRLGDGSMRDELLSSRSSFRVQVGA